MTDKAISPLRRRMIEDMTIRVYRRLSGIKPKQSHEEAAIGDPIYDLNKTPAARLSPSLMRSAALPLCRCLFWQLDCPRTYKRPCPAKPAPHHRHWSQSATIRRKL
jgi:hypothetical protein